MAELFLIVGPRNIGLYYRCVDVSIYVWYGVALFFVQVKKLQGAMIDETELIFQFDKPLVSAFGGIS